MKKIFLLNYLIIVLSCLFIEFTVFFDFDLNITSFKQNHNNFPIDSLSNILEKKLKIFPIPENYSYFNFIPQNLGSIKLNQTINWETDCFSFNSLHFSKKDNKFKLNLQSKKKKKYFCNDFYLFATTSNLKFRNNHYSRSINMNWQIPHDPNNFHYDEWYLLNKGIKIFRFYDNPLKTLNNILNTASLFIPLLTKNIPPQIEKRNHDFFKTFTNFSFETIQEFHGSENLIPDSFIYPGDTFGIIRMDGLDPMLGWAMGSTTGHVAVALEINNSIYIAESTATTSYWDTNGIQINPYKEWILKAKNAGFNTVHAPLTLEARKNFDNKKAVEFFMKHRGIDYGYPTLFTGWIDTVQKNYPCLPKSSQDTEYTHCLEWDHWEIVFGLLDHIDHETCFKMVGQSYYHRLFSNQINITEDLSLNNIFKIAYDKNISLNQLPTFIEKDEWNYIMKRNINFDNENKNNYKAMVCCTFTCNIWKAGKLFGNLTDEINCNEFTNYDIFSMSFLDKNPKLLEKCKKNDPFNNLCQLTGKYRLFLNDHSTRSPYKHMNEYCPSFPPIRNLPLHC